MGTWCSRLASRRPAIVVVAALVLSACTTYRGVAEFEVYRSAYEAAHAKGDAILDQLAIAERSAYFATQPESPRGLPRGFDPDEAAYYSEGVDPPGTAAFQRASDVIKAYNDLLYGFASGQTADALTAKVVQLGVKIDAAAKAAGPLAGAGSIEVVAVGAALQKTIAQLTPLLNVGLRYRGREVFREALVKHAGTIHELIAELRAGTRVIFPVLTREVALAGYGPQGKPRGAEEKAKIATYRALLSDWVLLLDASSLALDQAVAAIGGGTTIEAAIGGLTQTAIDVELVAKSAGKHLAELAVQ